MFIHQYKFLHFTRGSARQRPLIKEDFLRNLKARYFTFAEVDYVFFGDRTIRFPDKDVTPSLCRGRDSRTTLNFQYDSLALGQAAAN